MTPALALTAVKKDYRGLRPLRIRDLVVAQGEIVAISGPDPAAAEILTNLVTGSMLPDEGTVRVFGEDTAAIQDADAWLAGLDRFGIVSDRVALVGAFTLRQNIALALTMELDPLSDETSATVALLAHEVGLSPGVLDVAAGLAPALECSRVRLARAVAPGPRMLLVEHPTASVPREDVARLASDFFRVVRHRRLTALIASVDRVFVAGADRRLALDPATGALRARRLRAWFS